LISKMKKWNEVLWCCKSNIRGVYYYHGKGITMNIEFDADESKAIQVIGVLTARCRDSFDYYLAMKVVYALERTALIRWGQPVIGGNYRMLPYGPVNQFVMDVINVNRRGFFSECFDRCGDEIRLKKDPGTGELSRAEIKLIEQVCDEWKHLSFEQARVKAHSFPECAELEGLVVGISPERILQAAGKKPEQIAELAAENAFLLRLKRQ